MSPTLREELERHPPRFVGGTAGPGVGLPGLERSDGEFVHRLVCGCDRSAFRVLGVPVAMTVGGLGYVLRSALRVWRELRSASGETRPMAGRLTPPLVLACTGCGQLRTLVGGEPVEVGAAAPPLEALRCRPCRRSTFDAAVVCTHYHADLDDPARGGEAEHWDAWRLMVRCHACGSIGEPFSHGRRTSQQRSLDRLYGRARPGTEDALR